MNQVLSSRQNSRNDDMALLLRRCGENDSQAWGRLLGMVRRLALDLGRWKYRLGQEDAEDLAQVVQLRVTQRLPQLRDPVAFPSWIRQLTHHAVVDFMRRQRPTLSLDEHFPAVDAVAAVDTVGQYGQIELRTDLDRALARLPLHYREPIELHLLEGLPQDQVGLLLGRPRSTVASQIERGLRRLQRTLGPVAASL